MSTKKVASKTTRSHASKAPADAIDQQLKRYRSMRDFAITDEPSGHTRNAAQGNLPFVIQKHAASHLHYDLRLGWNGVLKSWAVAKGPSYSPRDKRLAVQVEDHPMEYGGFEGIIPQGQYGGGTVMLWDQGTWEPQPGHADIDTGLRTGSLKFTMHGTKMQGNWALIRMGGKAANERKPNWLLIKEHDSFERSAEDTPITEEAPLSVVTSRTMEQIAHSEDHVWNSKDTASKGKAWYRTNSKESNPALAKRTSIKKTVPVAIPLPQLKKLPKEKLPSFISPQLAQSARVPPTGEGWLHELKLDGYRIQAHKQKGIVHLYTRNGLDWTHRMSTIAAQVAALPVQSAIFDGEVVVLSEAGTTSFADLQAAFQESVKKPLTYFLFDLLHLNGHSTRSLPLHKRKSLLAEILESAGEYIRFSEHLDTSGETMFRKACQLHAEGIISKRASGKYVSGRSPDWRKLKCIHEQEFVIGGFTLPAKGRTGTHAIGSLLLGYYQKGKLIYAGRTGTGFTQKTHHSLRTQLEKLRQPTNPFTKPPADAQRDHPLWVKPQLVAQVNFATWTADDLVRQASFRGLREDKPAAEVTREEVMPPPQPRSARHTTTAGKEPAAMKLPSPAMAAPTLHLTHPEKILDASSGLTKQMLADYYWAVAPRMLPHIAGRPLSLVRCPEGSEKPCFYQKHKNHMLPPGIDSIDVPDKKTGKPEPYITLSTPEALAGLAQMGVLEVHPWGSRNDDLEHPDRLIIDLDPDPAISWKTLASSAAEVRALLRKLGLKSFLKLTGGKGLHVVLPMQPEYGWPLVKQFAHALVLQMERENPTLYLTRMTKSARKNRIYLDYLRNERGATSVAAFSPRARAGAAVSLPLRWADLNFTERPVFHAADLHTWKQHLTRDPWKQLQLTHQKLTPRMFQSLGVKL